MSLLRLGINIVKDTEVSIFEALSLVVSVCLSVSQIIHFEGAWCPEDTYVETGGAQEVIWRPSGISQRGTEDSSQ